MGYGSYTSNDWAKLKSSRGINNSSDVSQIFRNGELKDQYNPKFINMRESCDSSDSPLSTPIIIAFDDTASMGYLAEEIAKNALNRTITEIYDKQPVTNPHIMCAAFGNYLDGAPLQVTQFEADIKIAEQLFDIWIERRGQGYSGDSYVWYFASNHTKIDSFDKRRKKGFLFTIGDDICDRGLRADLAKKIYDDDIPEELSREQLIAMASEKYELFHIITKSIRPTGFESWNKLLPGRVANVQADGVKYLSEVIISIMQLVNGSDRNNVINQWDKEAIPFVSETISSINLNSESDIITDDTAQNNTEANAPKTKKNFFERLFGK